MRINEVERRVGVSKKNIRFYEEEGLLKPGRNAENGYREYSEADVEQLLKIRLLRQLFDQALDLRSSGSAALDLCYVASGRVNLFFEYQLFPWDYCAGSLILTEAGGFASQWNGGKLDLEQGGSVLAAGPNAYAAALQTACAVLA